MRVSGVGPQLTAGLQGGGATVPPEAPPVPPPCPCMRTLPEELPPPPHQGEGSPPPQTGQRPAQSLPAPFLSDGHCVHQVSPNFLGEGLW